MKTGSDIDIMEAYNSCLPTPIVEKKQGKLTETQLNEANEFNKFFDVLQSIISKTSGQNQDKLSDALVAWAVKYPNEYKKAAVKGMWTPTLFDAVWNGTDTTPKEITDLYQ